MRILLIEDQRDIAANIWDYLEHRGFVMDHAGDGASGLRMALDGDYDVIVLDLGLPKLDGLDLCRALRAANRDTPVLMLTARDTLDDKLTGLAEGADDYVVKPFAMKEVEARIRALYRRGRQQLGESLRLADLSLDPVNCVAERAGQRLALTHAGYTLLEALLRRAPNLVRHAELANALWGESGGDIATLHTHLSVLRAAVDRPFATRLLHTVHGFGYRLTDAPDE
ncbi:MAG: response regulator transcription factor [Xanthomonadaceae bacterium]|nr:response regulator transcription factor [Xanthomonadaceae bacterium]MDE1962232.1 response regulator transcription factor [Xanthomonadaceae bacterium]MDE2084798.1 response regulator transcription factor [Xanthomonadaceae bacterium]MDE2256916.1 response regulator transcription factor [Xanthomonadaceae bacterium]